MEVSETKLKMSRDSILEIQHKREQSHDSGTYQDWTLEETFPPSPGQPQKNADFVTVVAVDEKPYVTVLSVDSSPPDSEEVLVYRLPGERLGFGLKFDGGVKSAEKVKKLLIQSCADDSPASRTRASWGPLAPGDEILVIDSVPVSEMTRMDCVRALKESNVVIKLRVRKAGSGTKEEDKEAPPIPPRKFPRKKDLVAEPPPPSPAEEQKNSPPVLPRSRQIPQAETYTDLLSQETPLPTESESDDTGSSISTVVSRISSTPTTCNSSFSDARSLNSADFPPPQVPAVKPSAYDLDKVLEPFLHLEREFSSAAINENNIYHKLAEATNLLEPSKPKEEEPPSAPKPAPRQERRRPPPPPPPPRTDRQAAYPQARHLPRLIDFVPKDRTDVVVPSPLVPPPPTKTMNEEIKPKDEMKEQIKEAPDGSADTQKPLSDMDEFSSKQNNISLQEKSPPTFSRLPPDGHEYPAPQDKNCTIKPGDSKNLLNAMVTKEMKPKINIDSKKIVTETSKYSWRNDEKSEKSVRDKIAMFSSPQKDTAQSAKHVKKTSMGKPYGQEVADFAPNENDAKEKIDSQKQVPTMKKGSLPYQSLFDVTGNGDNFKNSVPKNEKTRSTLDLTENYLSNNATCKAEFSTLPRKSEQAKHSFEQKNYSSVGNNNLTRALSFSGESKLHSRSQSLIDVGVKNTSFIKSHDELRRSSLAALAEQRKKGYSKLRGLVIPEKLVEVPAQVVDDLPVIKSNDCLITENIDEGKANSMKTDVDKFYNGGGMNNQKPPIDKPTTLMPSPLWKAENNSEIPKYSPAFKRKSLSLYGTSSSVSSVSSSLSSSREELRICFNDSPKTLSGASTNIRSLAGLSRNPCSAHSEPKSLESITSPSISDVSYEYSQGSVSPNSNTCSDALSRFKYNEGYNSDTQRSKGEERLEEESDNDSAVSSSRSSISPPHSPMPGGKKSDSITPPLKNTIRYGLKLKRTLSSETTASNSSSGSTLTSGSQASCSSSGSCTSTENKRILKAQSVEAINRKNVLSSARYSSGADLKAEISPLEDKSDKDSENEQTPPKSPTSQDLPVISPQKEYPEATNETKDSDKTTPVNGNDSGFGAYHPQLEKSQIKNLDKCNELIKCETSFNIDDFTYSSHKRIDKNSNVKLNDYNDFTDGIASNDNQNKWQVIENNGSEYLPTSKINRPQLQMDPKYEKPKEDSLPLSKSINVNVNSMKKVFEKVDNVGLSNSRFKMNLSGQISIQHPRVSSVDSTNSDDSCLPNPSHYGSVSNLQKETQFGSITSLASSTSLISQQELSQLIEEANHTLEDEGNTHEVVVVILHRDIPGGSIGITLAGGADYEAKEITVHKVLIGSPAERDGRIQKGDRILSINGKSMKGLTHYESLAILKAPRPEVVLVVSRHKGDVTDDQNNSSASSKSSTSGRANRFPTDSKAVNQTKGKDTKWGPPVAVTLIKDGAGLGFSLEGGKDSPYGDQPLTIKKIFTGGCAEKCGNLFAGDELLSVNNIDVSELSRIEAWSLMKKLPDGEVHLSVRHQFT